MPFAKIECPSPCATGKELFGGSGLAKETRWHYDRPTPALLTAMTIFTGEWAAPLYAQSEIAPMPVTPLRGPDLSPCPCPCPLYRPVPSLRAYDRPAPAFPSLTAARVHSSSGSYETMASGTASALSIILFVGSSPRAQNPSLLQCMANRPPFDSPWEQLALC